MRITNLVVTNDFTESLVVCYEDHQNRFMIIPPSKTARIFEIVRDKIIEVEKLRFHFFNVATKEFQTMEFRDIQTTYKRVQD